MLVMAFATGSALIVLPLLIERSKEPLRQSALSKDKTVARLYDYWILGKHAVPEAPRWSVIRNVLHWVR